MNSNNTPVASTNETPIDHGHGKYYNGLDSPTKIKTEYTFYRRGTGSLISHSYREGRSRFLVNARIIDHQPLALPEPRCDLCKVRGFVIITLDSVLCETCVDEKARDRLESFTRSLWGERDFEGFDTPAKKQPVKTNGHKQNGRQKSKRQTTRARRQAVVDKIHADSTARGNVTNEEIFLLDKTPGPAVVAHELSMSELKVNLKSSIREVHYQNNRKNANDIRRLRDKRHQLIDMNGRIVLVKMGHTRKAWKGQTPIAEIGYTTQDNEWDFNLGWRREVDVFAAAAYPDLPEMVETELAELPF